MFVGRINNIQEQSTHIRYSVSDGTATIEVSKWVDNKDDEDQKSMPLFSYVVTHHSFIH